MPLAFDTLSHGSVAVGFCNVETDLLVLHHYVVFASDFCRWLVAWGTGPDSFTEKRPLWVVDNATAWGDLHAAIAGVESGGLMGALYGRWPFPSDPRDFRQKRNGYENRSQAEALLQPFARHAVVTLTVDRAGQVVAIGPCRFAAAAFRRVVSYLWRGGMPTWDSGGRPAYVEALGETVGRSGHWLFEGVRLTAVTG